MYSEKNRFKGDYLFVNCYCKGRNSEINIAGRFLVLRYKSAHLPYNCLT